MLVIVVVAAWMLRKTVFGRQILAVGGNEPAARLAGVPVGRVKCLVYVASGLCSGVAGLIVIAMNSAADANLIGMGMELDAIAAVAVGGTLLSGGRATIVGHADRRADHPARPLYAAGQRRARSRGPDRQGDPHRARRLAAAAGARMKLARASRRRARRPSRPGPAGRLRQLALRRLCRHLQHPDGAALQFDVRARRARHVLRHHDGRHRPVGRLGRGAGQRGLGLSQPLRAPGRACSAAWRPAPSPAP